MTALSEILGINKLINAVKIGVKTKDNKYTTLDKFLSKIVEQGTTENGSYIKYDNGILINYGKIKFNATTTAWGSFQIYDYKTPVTFPKAFIDDNIVVTAQCNNSVFAFFVGSLGVTKDAITQISVGRGNNASGEVTVVYNAIGRWK